MLRTIILACTLLCLGAPAIKHTAAQQNTAPKQKTPDAVFSFAEFESTLAQCAAAGRSKATDQLPAVQKALQMAHHAPASHIGHHANQLVVCGLMSLGRIGGEPALKLLQEWNPPKANGEYYREHYIPVIRAWIVTNMAHPSVKTTAEWQQKLEFFLNEAGVSMHAIREALHQHPQIGDRMVFPSKGVVALRVLLEMALEACQAGVRDALAPVNAVLSENDLRRDHAAWVRWKIACMSVSERVQWAIQTLTRREAAPFEALYEQAVLVEAGVQALEPTLRAVQRLLALRPENELAAEKRAVRVYLLLEVLATFEDPRVEQLLIACAQMSDDTQIAMDAERFLKRYRERVYGFLTPYW